MSEHIEVNLGDLIMNPDTQIRAKTRAPVVHRYAEAMRVDQQFPPITVARVMDGDVLRAYTLIDGWHRVLACRAIGRHRIDATVVDAEPHEFRWLAAQGNLKHGLQMTGAEKRSVFRAYVQARRHRNDKGRLKSCRDMASDLGGKPSRATIPIWMKKDFPKVYREMRRDGLIEEATGGHHSGDLSAVHARLAGDALEQFWASFRGVTDMDAKKLLADDLTRVARNAAEAVTGERSLPELIEDAF